MRKPGVDAAEPSCVFALPCRINCLHLRGRVGISPSWRVIANDACAQAVQRDSPLLDGGAYDAIIVEVKEEEELVASIEQLRKDNRSSNSSAKLILNQVVAGANGR